MTEAIVEYIADWQAAEAAYQNADSELNKSLSRVVAWMKEHNKESVVIGEYLYQIVPGGNIAMHKTEVIG